MPLSSVEPGVPKETFRDLVQRARSFDSAAWDHLYGFAFPQVYRYVAARVDSRIDAEDITEDVFLGALQSAAALRASDEAGLMAWLFQIARNKMADRLRRQYRKPTELLDPGVEVSDPDPTPEEAALDRDEAREVREALGSLTDEQREVIVMKYALEYDNARAAAVLGKSVGAINQLQHRALSALRRVLDG